MKKYFSFMLVLLLTLGIVSSLGSCNKKNEEPAPTKGEITIADFEEWAPDFQLIRVNANFGKVSRNEDKAFVKNGSYSAKIQPLGGYSTKSEPVMTVPLVSSLFEYDYSDFRWYKSVKCSIYSTGENMVKIGVIAGDGVNSFGGSKVLEKKYFLKDGWNELTYEVNPSLIALTQDPRFINGIAFSFANAGSRELDDAPVLYLDDIKLEKRAQMAEVLDLIDLKPYEIIDFEELWQEYVVSWSGNAQIIPDMEIVGSQIKDGRAITPTSGKNMLRMNLKAGTAVQGSLNYIIIPASMMQAAFENLTDAEINNGYICFDVYNNGGAPITLYPWTYNSNRTPLNAYDFIASTDRWVSYKIKISDLKREGQRLQNDIGTFEILYWEFIGEDIELFFDNFRIIV